MGRTKKWRPRDGEFKSLRGSKKARNKKQRARKAELQNYINLKAANDNK